MYESAVYESAVWVCVAVCVYVYVYVYMCVCVQVRGCPQTKLCTRSSDWKQIKFTSPRLGSFFAPLSRAPDLYDSTVATPAFTPVMKVFRVKIKQQNDWSVKQLCYGGSSKSNDMSSVCKISCWCGTMLFGRRANQSNVIT